MILITTLRIWLCKHVLKTGRMYFAKKIGIPNAPLGSVCLLEDVGQPFDILIKTESGWCLATDIERHHIGLDLPSHRGMKAPEVE